MAHPNSSPHYYSDRRQGNQGPLKINPGGGKFVSGGVTTSIAQYKIGSPTRPNIYHDNGFLDKFSPRKPTAADREQFAKWAAILEAAEAAQDVPLVPHNDIPDALAAYRHFLYGKGKDREFSYERYVKNDRAGAVTFESAIIDLKQGVELIYFQFFKGQSLAHFHMTGSAIEVGRNGKFPYPKTENWQKAIGAHAIWLSADVDVINQHNIPQYKMKMTLHAEDRYNFNPGAQDINTGIPDSANGIFEITGLGHQYMNYATLEQKVNWSGLTSGESTSKYIDHSRERQPTDNRRIRNRL